MFRSATFKLTLWYIAIVMTISLLFSAVLYYVATAELARGLYHETERIYRQFPVFEDSPYLSMHPDYSNGARRILLQLGLLNLLVLLCSGYASYRLARRTLRPIEAAHEQQKRFTADVSHELRTPLTALRMESEVALMNSKLTAGAFRQTLQSNLEEVAKIEALINNLLRLTRLEADQLQQDFMPLSAVELLTEAVAQVTKTAAAQHVRIDYESADTALVLGDRASLVQLLVILLDNAVKYSTSKSVVAVTLERRQDYCRFVIQDQGPGIEPAALEHVFERFYRAEASRTKAGRAEGFGLGLSIAQMIAELHGSTITLTSRVGHGTTAIVELRTISSESDSGAKRLRRLRQSRGDR